MNRIDESLNDECSMVFTKTSKKREDSLPPLKAPRSKGMGCDAGGTGGVTTTITTDQQSNTSEVGGDHQHMVVLTSQSHLKQVASNISPYLIP